MMELTITCKQDVDLLNTLKFYKCSTFSSIFSFFESDGITPVDLTGVVEIKFHLLEKNSLVDYLVITLTPTVLGSEITITDAINGIISILITDEETCLFPFYEGKWWISLTYLDGTTLRKAAGILDIREPFEL